MCFFYQKTIITLTQGYLNHILNNLDQVAFSSENYPK